MTYVISKLYNSTITYLKSYKYDIYIFKKNIIGI